MVIEDLLRDAGVLSATPFETESDSGIGGAQASVQETPDAPRWPQPFLSGC